MAETSPASAVDRLIDATLADVSHQPDHHALAVQVVHNLRHQHDWTQLAIHLHSPLPGPHQLPRPLVSGMPPRRVYLHPEEQIDFIKAGVQDQDIPPEREWILPSHLREKWSLSHFGRVFDAITSVPPLSDAAPVVPPGKWRETKRLLLATLDDDSTIVYYVVHDGVVKPRQN